MMIEFFKYFLPSFLPLYFVLAFVLPSCRVWKHSNVNAVTFRAADDAEEHIGNLLKAVTFGLS